MNQKGKKKGRESLSHRIAAILYSILLVLSLVPTQGLAEARDEAVDLIDETAVELGVQSDGEEVQALGSEDAHEEVVAGTGGDEVVAGTGGDEVVAGTEGDEVVAVADEGEEIVAIANDGDEQGDEGSGSFDDWIIDPKTLLAEKEKDGSDGFGFLMMEDPGFEGGSNPDYYANEHPEDLMWTIRFKAPASGYPSPTKIQIEYPRCANPDGSGEMYYDVLSRQVPVLIGQTLPSGTNPDEEIVEVPTPPSYDDMEPWEQMMSISDSMWEDFEQEEQVIPIRDDYYIARHDDGFEIVFSKGLSKTTYDREITVRFWLTVNQEWRNNQNASTEHESAALIVGGDPANEDFYGWAKSFASVHIPAAECQHANTTRSPLSPTKHRVKCNDCGYYYDEEHVAEEKTVINPETDEESVVWKCKDCGYDFATISFMLTSDSTDPIATDHKGIGDTYVLPKCTFNPPAAGQHFNSWEVTYKDGKTEVLFPNESVDLKDDITVTAVWQGEIPYKDALGETSYLADYEVIDSRTADLAAGWYVVQDYINLSDRYMSINNGEVNLVLCKDAMLVTSGINIMGSGVLNIYGQPDGAGEIYSHSNNVIKNYNKLNIYDGTFWGATSSGIFNSGELLLAGGTITQNTKGIEQSNALTAKLSVRGSAKVVDNESVETDSDGNETGVKKSDIVLPTGMTIDVVGNLSGAELWVRTQEATPCTITSGYSAGEYDNPGDPTQVFMSDYTNMAICQTKTSEGEVQTEKAVLYVTANGNREYIKNYTPITSSTMHIGGGWYAVEKNVTVSTRFEIDPSSEPTNIILCDGVTFTCPYGVRTNNNGQTLYIWGQDKQTGTLLAGAKVNSDFTSLVSEYEDYVKSGENDEETTKSYATQLLGMVSSDYANLNLFPSNTTDPAGIGGNSAGLTTVKVYGGRIAACGYRYGSGIGGGGGSKDRNGNEKEGKLEVYRGTVLAKGGAAGIGGGGGGYVCEVLIRGGVVLAQGGWGAAGIGGGSNSINNKTSILGGNVYAQGGSGAPGIGCGAEQCQAGDITIAGASVVTAIGGTNAAGIGCGNDPRNDSFRTKAGNISITGTAKVTARGGTRGAGIGGGADSYAAKDEYVCNVFIGNGSPTVKAVAGPSRSSKSKPAGIGAGETDDCGGNGKGGYVVIGELQNVSTGAVLVPTVEAYSPSGGAAIGSTNDSAEEGVTQVANCAMVTFGNSPDSGKRTCLSNERESKTQEPYAKIERCDHKGFTGEDQRRYSNMGGTHQEHCLLCKSAIGEEEAHTYGDDGLCTVCGFGQDLITYIDEKGNQKTRPQSETEMLSMYYNTSGFEGGFASGWYYADSAANLVHRAEISGEVNLILRDNVQIVFERGIHIPKDAVLNIWAQTGESGSIVAGSDKFQLAGAAAIGGNNVEGMGTFNMRGGAVYATGFEGGAGIGSGSGSGGSGGTINIYRGVVEATGGKSAAGIGGGSKGWISEINVYGGTVTATSGSQSGDRCGAGMGGGDEGKAGVINIYDGDVKAKSTGYGAGIGAGSNPASSSAGQSGSWGTVNISGGLVYAEGANAGAGIGGGYRTNGCDITITGGKVDAVCKGGSDNDGDKRGGAGIGGGAYGSGQKVSISGGTVNASSVGGAGIGSGRDAGMSARIDITGGTVKAECAAGYYSGGWISGAGIGTSNNGNNQSNITISGANTKVIATGYYSSAGIGGGSGSSSFSGTLKILDGAEVTLQGGDTSNMPAGPISSSTSLDMRLSLYENAKVVNKVGDASSCASRDKRLEALASSTSSYAKVMPCDHPSKSWVSTDDTNHWKKCNNCLAEKSDVGLVLPHDFVLYANHACSCGRQGREIELRPGYGTGKVTKTYAAVGSYYTIPSAKGFTPPADGEVEAKFAGWRIGGLSKETDQQSLQYNDSIMTEGEILIIPSRLPNPEDPADMLDTITLTATWTDPRGVPYTNLEGDTSYVKRYTNMTAVTDRVGVTLGSEGATSWYYVDKDIEYKNRMDVVGDVNIILGDYQTLTLKEGIHVGSVGSDVQKLTIWCQREGTGCLNATSRDYTDDNKLYEAAIGGNTQEACGSITINGGVISAVAGSTSRLEGTEEGVAGMAGIGGGSQSGIGPTNNTAGITINGGKVYAKGSGVYGAGIGNGGSVGSNYVNRGFIVINDGEVTAEGGKYSAGIGGSGKYSSNNRIEIHGGVVKATGGEQAPGIGTGIDNSDKYDITIDGKSNVTAQGGAQGSGIGGGVKQGGTGTSAQNIGIVTIAGNAHVKADGLYGGAGIGGGVQARAAKVTIKDSAIVEASNGNIYGQNLGGACAIGHGSGIQLSYDPVLYNEATVLSKDREIKEDNSVAAITIYALSEERTDWFASRNYVKIQPCTHKNVGQSYQAKYEPTEDQTKHVLICKFCNIQESEPNDHTFNSKGVCSKCGATGIQMTFNANGGTGSFAPYIVADGDVVKLPTKCPFKAPEGMRFAGWTINTDEYDDPSQLKALGAEVTIDGNTVAYAQWKPQPTLAVWSSTYNLQTSAVAHITIEPGVQEYYAEGSEITVTAPILVDYNFNGWYNVVQIKDDGSVAVFDDNVVSKDAAYKFKIMGDVKLVALYTKKTAKVDVKVNVVNSAQYMINDSESYQSSTTVNPVVLGDTFRLTAREPDRVLKWTNESENVIGTGESVSFVVTRSTTITLYYKYEDETSPQTFVQFVSDYGQTIASRMYSPRDSTVNWPVAPSKMGYKFTQWVFDGTDPVESAGSETEDPKGTKILAKVAQGAATLTIKPEYVYEGSPSGSQTVQITFKYVDSNWNPLTNGSDSYKTGEVKYGNGVTFAAPSTAPGGTENKNMVFDHWEDNKGKVLVYGRKIPIVATTDKVYYAVYINKVTETPSNKKPMVVQYSPVAVEEDGTQKVKAIAGVSIPTGWTLVDYGLVSAFDYDENRISSSTIVLDGGNMRQPYIVEAKEGTTAGVIKVNISVGEYSERRVTMRAYAHVKNTKTNQMEIVYSDIITTSYKQLNG